MDWTNIYKKKVMSVTDAIDAFIKDGYTVALGGLAIAVAWRGYIALSIIHI